MLIYLCRTYDATTTEAYYNWYRMSTRTRLTSEPPTMPTHPTHMEQLQRRMDTSSAYYRDSAVIINILLFRSIIS